MTNVQKGIIADNAECSVNKVGINGATFGIAGKVTGKNITVENSLLDTVYTGIYVLGFPSAGSNFGGNTIRTYRRQQIKFGNMIGNYTYPQGIAVDYPAGAANGTTWTIQSNIIEVAARKGVGINIQDGKKALSITNNNIKLNPPSGPITSNFIHMGIYCLSCTQEIVIQNNTVTGNAFSFTAGGRTSFPSPVGQSTLGEASGITLTNGGPQVRCNKIDSVVNGIHARGSCGASLNPSGNFQVQGNQFYEANLGFVFRTITGTSNGQPIYYRDYFGTKVGNNLNDNNNKFLGSGANLDFYTGKTTRAKILTLRDTLNGWNTDCGTNYRNFYVDNQGGGTNIIDNESQSSGSAFELCRYFVVPDQGMSIYAGCGSSVGAARSGFSSVIDSSAIAKAEEVARDTNLAPLSAPALRWLMAKELYEDLISFPDAIVESPVLDSFYNSLNGSTYDQIRYAEEAYAALGDSTVYSDPTLLDQAYQSLSQAVANINVTNAFEQNEQSMIALYLKVNKLGLDSLTAADKQLIDGLAYSCETVAGSAVFKARFLYQFFHTRTDFSTMDLCTNLIDPNAGSRISQETKGICRVYPNPVSDQLYLAYRFDEQVMQASLELRDIMGRMVRMESLPKDAGNYSINVSSLPEGIYHYRVVADGKPITEGKLLKQN